MKRGYWAIAGVVFAVLALVMLGTGQDSSEEAAASAPAVLSVETAMPQIRSLSIQIPASGSVAAWQDASVGAESNGLRLTDITVNVGDRVRRGQVLARFNTDLLKADLAQAKAAVALAEAEALDAEQSSQRAKGLDESGAMSAQLVNQYATAAMTAQARLEGARAVAATSALRLRDSVVLAPIDGIITARPATLGAVVPSGQELFRLIVDGRLEWRAAVSTEDLAQLSPGQGVTITRRDGEAIRGELRMVAPEIDAQTRSGLVYVDLPSDSGLRPGTFVTGTIQVGDSKALTVPQSAVILRDGFHVVMVVDAASKVKETQVEVGQRVGDRVEISAGLTASERIVASGLSFLGDGDTVRVVDSDTTADVAVEKGLPGAGTAQTQRGHK
jgi:RND family efflux transporter MFP subunit